MNYKIRYSALFILFALFLFSGCQKWEEVDTAGLSPTPYKTEKVIVVVIDGPRYSETWGDPSGHYEPRMRNVLSREGVVNSAFYNNGTTRTVPGHTAICTGRYEEMDNRGDDNPSYPSFLQLYLKASGLESTKAWVVTSKEKLGVLAECRHPDWEEHYHPAVNAMDRNDVETFEAAKQVLTDYEPNVMLLHFRGPDFYGHFKNWNGYLSAIRETDSLTSELLSYLETLPAYTGRTTVFVTNDHGRHLDSKGGFDSHGCGCEGCRHINFFAYGPDFRQDVVLDQKREQLDIAPTVCELLGVQVTNYPGQVMKELFH